MLKRLLNLHEEATHTRLKAVCDDYKASVYLKIRLADVIPIEGSGISDKEFSFALKSHFDFVIFDSNYEPLFAVEFDGHFHRNSSQIQRDKLKNKLCDKFNPVLYKT